MRELEAFAAVVYSTNFADATLPLRSPDKEDGSIWWGERSPSATAADGNADNANNASRQGSTGSPAPRADVGELGSGGKGDVPDIGGEESTDDLGIQQHEHPSVPPAGGRDDDGDGDGTPSFEKVWGRAVEQQQQQQQGSSS